MRTSKLDTLTPSHRVIFISLLLVFNAVAFLPFRFTDGFGERDSYRMLLGALDTLQGGTPFNSSLLYNREPSFGYYGFLYAVAKFAEPLPQFLIPVMNELSLWSMILFVIPEFLLVERLFGARIAIVSGFVLTVIPSWWYTALYAHPITPALLLFFTAMAILSGYREAPSWLARIGVTLLLSAALMFRFDTVLLFVPLFAVLLARRESRFVDVVKEFAFYTGASLALFFVTHALLPKIVQGEAPESILQLLARFHSPALFLSGARLAIQVLGGGFTPLLLLTIPFSAWILYRRRDFAGLLFVTGIILVNLAFWLPNPSPARHYLMMAPALSISAALVVMAVLDRLPIPQRVSGPAAAIAGVAAAFLIVTTSVVAPRLESHLAYFRSPFPQRLGEQNLVLDARQVAVGLTQLKPLPTPVVVLCDSNFVIAEMERLAPATTAVRVVTHAGAESVPVHVVELGPNRFVMVEQSWLRESVAGFDQSGQYPGIPVLDAPFLSLPYDGTRPRLSVTR